MEFHETLKLYNFAKTKGEINVFWLWLWLLPEDLENTYQIMNPYILYPQGIDDRFSVQGYVHSV